MKDEAQMWLKNHYSKDFTIDYKEDYNVSVTARTVEDDQINDIIQDYIIERLKEVKIKSLSPLTHDQVVQGRKQSSKKK